MTAANGTAALPVSVVIPTRQRRAHVVRAVRSVLAQTHPAAEVIVVDDGSTDGTAEALAAFGERIVYLRQNHAGASAARNLGVRHARGEIVAFLDDDDRWRPEHLSAVIKSFALHPTAAAVSLGPGFSFDALTFSRAPVLVQPLPRLLIGSFVGYPSATAVRRRDLIEAGGFDEAIVGSEGYDMWLRLSRLGGFVLSRRHTVIRRKLRDSIGDAAVADGRFLAARERTGETAQANLAPLSPALGRATASYRSFVAALRALQDGDEAAAAAALTDACRLDPERSREPWLIAGWLGILPRAETAEGKLWTAAWFAEHWPDPRCTAALGLRLHAAYRALRLRRPWRAAEILWRAPRGPLLRFTISELARAARAQGLRASAHT